MGISFGYSMRFVFFVKAIAWIFTFSALGFVIVSCNYSKVKNNVEPPTALAVVENAINTAGTLEKWRRISSLTYTKKSRLLLENGEIESEVTQRHHYEFGVQKRISIAWEVAQDSFLIVQNDSVSLKFKNDSLVAQGSSVKSTVNSALYVLGMPFKLLDKGTELHYEGIKSLNHSDSVHTVKATYAPEQHQNHSTSDVWWYHFNQNDYHFSSSLVYHEPTYALIENEIVVQAEGLIFPGVRKSYRCDAHGKKQFLRAEFWYEDYHITFLNE